MQGPEIADRASDAKNDPETPKPKGIRPAEMRLKPYT